MLLISMFFIATSLFNGCEGDINNQKEIEVCIDKVSYDTYREILNDDNAVRVVSVMEKYTKELDNLLLRESNFVFEGLVWSVTVNEEGNFEIRIGSFNPEMNAPILYYAVFENSDTYFDEVKKLNKRDEVEFEFKVASDYLSNQNGITLTKNRDTESIIHLIKIELVYLKKV